jgi:predicted ATPase
LLTVTGGGGLGKTRLSLEMANACAADYVDGVWFVDLAPITDPRLVSQAVALVVGVADQAAERMLGAVQSFIRNRRALLILDNCEHLLRSCAEVVGGRCARARSSRSSPRAASRCIFKARRSSLFPRFRF